MKLPRPTHVPYVRSAIEFLGEDFPIHLFQRSPGDLVLAREDLADIRSSLLLFKTILDFAGAFCHEIEGVALLETRAGSILQALEESIEDANAGFTVRAFQPASGEAKREDLIDRGHRINVALRRDAYAAVYFLHEFAGQTLRDARRDVAKIVGDVFGAPKSGGSKPRSQHGLSARSLERDASSTTSIYRSQTVDFARRAFGSSVSGVAYWFLDKNDFAFLGPRKIHALIETELRKSAARALRRHQD